MIESAVVIGREEELKALFATSIEASRPTILLGDAGVGKTALIQQLEGEASRRGLYTAKGTCFNVQPPISFLPVLTVLGEVARHFNIRVPEILQKFEGLTSDRWNTSASDLRLRLFYEVARSLQGLAEVGRHVFIIEDLHSADLDTLQLLNYLASQKQEGISFCFTARPNALPDRERTEAFNLLVQGCVSISLGGLHQEESGRLLSRICGPLHDHEANYLHALTRGNPLFLHELGRYLREAGALGRSSAQDIIERLGLPRTLDGLLDQSVARLPDEHHEVLGAASCMGSQFNRSLLAHLAAVDRDVVEDALAGVQSAGLIRAVDDVDLEVMEFVNPLVRERVYRSLVPSRRRKMHADLLELDRELGGLVTVEERAIHFARAYAGSDNSAAVEACQMAAERAESLLAFQSASDFWRLALSCAVPGMNRERAELLCRQGLASRAAGNWARANLAMRRSYEIHEALGDLEVASELSYLIGEMERFALDLPSAIQWLDRSINNPLATDMTKARALALLGSAYVALDQVDVGASFLMQALDFARAAGGIPPDVARWAYFGLTLTGKVEEAGDMALLGLAAAEKNGSSTDTAHLASSLTFWSLHKLLRVDAERFVALAESLPPPVDTAGLISTISARTILEAYSGNWAGVYRSSESWLKHVRLAGEFQKATALLVLAEASSILGRHQEAMENIDLAVSDLGSMRPLGSLYKGRILLRAGQLAESRALLEQWGEQVLLTEKSPGGRAFLGDLVSSLGHQNLAHRLYERLVEESRPLLIVYTPTSVQRVLGKLAALLGMREQAYEHFERAIEGLAEGGAAWELGLTYLDYAQYRGRSNQRREQKKSRLLSNEGGRIFAALGVMPPSVWLDGSPSTGVPSPDQLSKREREILELVRDGRTNRDIALELSLSVHTVDRHMEHILAKLGASNRAEAVAKGTEEAAIPGATRSETKSGRRAIRVAAHGTEVNSSVDLPDMQPDRLLKG